MDDVALERAALRDLIRTRSYREGRFTLASGRTSNRYFNLKPTMMHPQGAASSARALLAIAHEAGCAHVTGLEMGAVPVIGAIAAVSLIDDDPVATGFIRKAAKGHGTQALIEGLAEGESLENVRVLVVDDVATSGGSVLQAIEAVREAGGVVTDAAVLVDRQEGAAEMLAEHGVTLHRVFTADEIASDA